MPEVVTAIPRFEELAALSHERKGELLVPAGLAAGEPAAVSRRGRGGGRRVGGAARPAYVLDEIVEEGLANGE